MQDDGKENPSTHLVILTYAIRQGRWDVEGGEVERHSMPPASTTTWPYIIRYDLVVKEKSLIVECKQTDARAMADKYSSTKGFGTPGGQPLRRVVRRYRPRFGLTYPYSVVCSTI